MSQQWQRDLPIAKTSTLHPEVTIELYRSPKMKVRDCDYQLVVTATYGDYCRNGINAFHYRERVVFYGTDREPDMVSVSDLKAKRSPELAALSDKYRKWHGCTAAGPWAYIENTVYHAGDRDCLGLRAGEFGQVRNGKTGQLCWQLVLIDPDGNELPLTSVERRYVDSAEKPDCPYTVEYRPYGHIGNGKARELDYARNSAIWPEATDEELMVEPEELKAKLKARLPELLEGFKNAVECIGFEW